MLFAFSVLLGLAILEVGLRVATPLPIHGEGSNRQVHEALGYVVSPLYPGIDRFGFRNPDGQADREDIELVTLGDSHTYSQNVSSAESWPYILGRMADLNVYNYGVGGYGILHYAFLFDQALEKYRPDHVVVGLFLANDFGRYCKFARRPYWRETLRQEGIEDGCPEGGPGDRFVSSWAARLVDRLKSTAIGSALIYHIWYPLETRLAGNESARTSVLQYGSRRTYLQSSFLTMRHRLMDLDTPAVRTADHAAQILFKRMAERARRESVKLSILFIPSKENAVFDMLSPATPHYREIRELVEEERALIERYRQFFGRIGVSTASARAALSSRLPATQVYAEDVDSHPLAVGYVAYAEAALPLLR
ncbi:MAG: hypothetical protein O7E57_05980 [Gammaproteobacteria bacterium]|nr:hypothetical protein [Gammaproteobacteria bacterium]